MPGAAEEWIQQSSEGQEQDIGEYWEEQQWDDVTYRDPEKFSLHDPVGSCNRALSNIKTYYDLQQRLQFGSQKEFDHIALFISGNCPKKHVLSKLLVNAAMWRKDNEASCQSGWDAEGEYHAGADAKRGNGEAL